MAFPIQLTSSRDSSSSISSSSYTTTTTTTNNENPANEENENSTTTTAKLPELFRENNDQTSVTSPEALTFLQLLNGVDMATPILGPDTLSSIVVSYAFLMAADDDTADDDGNDDDDDDESQSALEYVRAMVRTTLPPGLDYSDASPWQRARVKMPRAWLRGVRLERATLEESNDDGGCPDNGVGIGRVPVRFVLECSVDDGSKRFEIPLFAVPSSSSSSVSPPNVSSLQQQQQQLDISEEILQELSHDYNGETSASFVSLALFHRYSKSNAGNADQGPTLKASDALLLQLEGMQEKDGQTRYCWSVGNDNNDDNDSGSSTGIDSIIQTEGLPLYRTLSQIQEEDQRVLQHLEEQNFGSDDAKSIGDNNNNNTNDIHRNNDKSLQRDQPTKQTLTAKQQALQQTLKSAWKIATQKEDTKALEKIQKAMEDLEKEVIENNARILSDNGNNDSSSLERIQRAMQKSDDDDGENEEDSVGLILELEEATMNAQMEDAIDAQDEAGD
eukprot:CAMPEP_0196161822 /NCGR_PEP_ID=MMETSP0910-20130528/47524_1 /TAXON_ID=49265 /ORGANISM="Thalassiosira rotula, Strain GSO102" /LENGTH=502 /DNA_ID=CAMNT_0041426767 /DNA_START=81 /DNA_END=1590 /DNA_ORIENTATION=-